MLIDPENMTKCIRFCRCFIQRDLIIFADRNDRKPYCTVVDVILEGVSKPIPEVLEGCSMDIFYMLKEYKRMHAYMSALPYLPYLPYLPNLTMFSLSWTKLE